MKLAHKPKRAVATVVASLSYLILWRKYNLKWESQSKYGWRKGKGD